MHPTLLAALLFTFAPPSDPDPAARRLVWGDLDRDGRLDVVVLDAAGLKLLHNAGDGVLEDWTARLGVEGIPGARSASLADVDGDGDADLFVGVTRAESRLFLREEGVFRDAGTESGLALGPGVVAHQWVDWNDDGLPDLSLSTRGGEQFYENLGGGAFRPLVSATLPPERTAPPAVGDTEKLEPPAAPPVAAGVPPATITANPASSNLIPYIRCAFNLRDEVTGNCLPASTLPTYGKLYPLGQEFMIDDSTGNVGIGITDPAFKLDVTGDARATQLTLTEPEDVPLTVASSKWVENLNVDLLDGFDSSAFSMLGASIEGGEITNGTITDADVSAAAAIAGTKIAPDFGAQDVTTAGRLIVNSPISSATVAVNSTASYGIEVFSAGSSAIRGEQTGPGGSGVLGWAMGTGGVGVFGTGGHTGVSGAGPQRGVLGQATAVLGTGVVGSNDLSGGTLGSTLGVTGVVFAEGTGVVGRGSSGFAISDGVNGIAYHPGSYSVFGDGQSGAHGVVGAADSGGIAVVAQGDLSCSGAKNFVQPHPSDPGLEIAFACLEGNESGTYFRGTSRLVAGVAVIDVPEEFRLVTVPEGLTVQVTERGPGQVWIESSDLDRVVLRGRLDVAFDYQVNGLRRGFEEREVVRANRVFRPRVADEPWGAFLPEELRADLVNSGVLNADFTPNRATAAQLGWTLSEKAPAVEEER